MNQSSFGGQDQAVKKSGTGCFKWGIVGCLAMTVIGGLGIAAVVFLVFGMIKGSDPYAMALSEAQASPALQQAIGEPIEAGWWVMGSTNTSGPSGDASVSFPVQGPNGSANISYEAVKSAGEWHLRVLAAELDSGERLDLLTTSVDVAEIAGAFLTLVANGDYGAAHEYFSQPLQEVQPLDSFTEMASANAVLFDVERLDGEQSDGAQGPRWEGTATLRGGQSIPAHFEVIREGKDWRLISYQLGS